MAMMQKQKESVNDHNEAQFGTRATMYNKTPRSLMTLDRSINWSGHPSTGSFPDNIPTIPIPSFTIRGRANPAPWPPSSTVALIPLGTPVLGSSLGMLPLTTPLLLLIGFMLPVEPKSAWI